MAYPPSTPKPAGAMADDANRARDRATAGLVRLLVALTFVTGIVDAVSILRLGHVFVANMTGNLVFLGFALAGASGFSVLASLTAVAAFVVGAAVGARLPTLAPTQMLGRMVAIEAGLCAGATVVAATSGGAGARYAMTVLLALAMGGQNATVRKLAIPDMTTTVLTLTLTGLAADAPDLRTPGSHTRRRTVAVFAMLGGAVLGALVVLHGSTAWALAAATTVLAAVALGAWRLAHPPGPAVRR